jgi:hypothetical protein
MSAYMCNRGAKIMILALIYFSLKSQARICAKTFTYVILPLLPEEIYDIIPISQLRKLRGSK